MNRQLRVVLRTVGLVLAIWALAMVGHRWARDAKPTAERVARYLASTPLRGLSAEARAGALRRLAELLNELSADERRKARMARVWGAWFEEMTDEEKTAFIEATAPSGFRQMLGSFERLPEDRRRKAIDDAVRRLREARDAGDEGGLGGLPPEMIGTNANQGNLVFDDAVRQRVTEIGLKTYYSRSSAQTKAELAPLLEELQHMMEGGHVRRGPGR